MLDGILLERARVPAASIVTEQVLSFVLDACDRLMVIERGRMIHEDTRDRVDAARVKQLLAV